MWLPKLADDGLNNVGNISDDNGFMRGDSAGLIQLANAMKLNDKDSKEIRSIPDIYFNASKFSMCLFDDNDKEQNKDKKANFLGEFAIKAKAEWRALLAVCITADVFLKGSGFRLVVENALNNGQNQKLQNNYTIAALRMLPTDGIWTPSEYRPNNKTGVNNGNDWTWGGMKVILLRSDNASIDDIPIAFTSPDTIIFPAADWYTKLSKCCANVFPWVKLDGFIDPTNDTEVKLTTQLVKYIVTWLEDYRIFLKETQSAKEKLIDEPKDEPKDKPKDEPANKFQINDSVRFNKLCNYPDTNNPGSDISLLSEFRNAFIGKYEEVSRSELSDFWKTWRFQPGGKNTPSEYTLAGCESLASICPKAPSLVGIPEDEIPSDVLVRIPPIDGHTVIYLDNSMRYKTAAGMYTVGDALDKAVVRNEIEQIFHVLKSDDIFLPQVFISNDLDDSKEKLDIREEYLTCVHDHCIYKDVNGKRTNLCIMPLTAGGFSLIRVGGKYSLHIETDSSGAMTAIKASFTIVLKNGTPIDISKCYSVDDEQVKYLAQNSSLPIAAVWPRVDLGERWKEYWLFCYDTPDAKTDREESYLVGNHHYRLEPVEITGQEIRPKSDACHRYYCLEQFPSYLCLFEDNSPLPVGYIELQSVQYDEPPSELSDYRFSLDFGTASTVVHASPGTKARSLAGSSTEHALNVALGVGNIIGIPITANPNERSLYLTKYFMRHLTMPFATLLHDYNLNNRSDTREIYRHSHIYLKELLKRDQKVFDDNEVATNIKWDQKANPEHVRIFLEDLFRFILLDARMNGLETLNNLHIMASYPDSMTEDIRNDYIKEVESHFISTAKRVAGLEGQLEMKSMTESEAAARYFTNRLNTDASINEKIDRLCVIDIGGGTSDIYYSESYVDSDGDSYARALESSIKIGARNILVNALYQSTQTSISRGEDYKDFYLYKMLINANLLYDKKQGKGAEKAPLGIEDIDKILNTQGGEKGLSSFAATWESLLNRKYTIGEDKETTLGDELLKYWAAGRTKVEAKDKWLLSIIGLNIGAIVYYAAMLMRESLNKDANLHIAFAGNGSKMLDWLGQNTAWIRFLKKIILDALSPGESNLYTVTFHKSEEHKHEAVKGMFLVDEPLAQITAANNKIFSFVVNQSGNQNEKLEALPIILAGESFEGGVALSVEQCEKLLREVYDKPDNRGDERHQYELSKEDKINNHESVKEDKRVVNKSTSDLSECNLKSKLLTEKTVETKEFYDFIDAYNSAIVNFSNMALLPVEWRSGQSFTSINVGDKSNWLVGRNAKIKKYINSVIGAKANEEQSTIEMKSFFQIGLEELNERMMK